LSEQHDSAADPLDEIKALQFTDPTRSDVDWLIETVERLVRQKGQAWDLADKYGMRELELIGEVERLREEVFELKIYRGFGQDHGHQRCVEEITRLRAEVVDLKITLATASPGAYFSRYGERSDLSPEGEQP
jgi:hypothetical protein